MPCVCAFKYQRIDRSINSSSSSRVMFPYSAGATSFKIDARFVTKPFVCIPFPMAFTFYSLGTPKRFRTKVRSFFLQTLLGGKKKCRIIIFLNIKAWWVKHMLTVTPLIFVSLCLKKQKRFSRILNAHLTKNSLFV